MKKMLSKVLALTLCVALGLSLVGGAFAAEPQTGTFDLESSCYDYGQLISTVVVNLDTPVGDVTEEEVIAAFTVTVMGYDRNFYGFLIQGDMPRTVTGATVSEDGKTITLELQSTPDDSIVGTTLYPQFSDGYEVKLVSALGNLTTDLALTFSGKTTDPVADKWGAVAADNDAGTYAYRWFDPSDSYEMPETGYPVIVWIHGAGEWGSDNNAQLTANRVTAWGEAETQDIFGGAYVIAPQADRSNTNPAIQGWTGDNIKATIEDLIALVGEENVDRNRIVIGGCSAGGAGTINAIVANPDYYAAAFPICPAGTISQVTETTIALLDLPIYLIHSIDDNTVNVGNSITTYNTFKNLGKDNIYLALFEHVWFEGLADTAEAMANYGHWSWVYAHNNFKGEDKYWAPEYLHTDEVTYKSTVPSELGYETFKHWLADQVRPSDGTYYTRYREVAAFGETISSITIHNLPNRIKATETVADYLAANPIVVTVLDATLDAEGTIGEMVREPIETIVGEDRTSITFVYGQGEAFVDPVNAPTHAYKVTVNGEEIQYGGDECDTADFLSKTYTTPEYTSRGTQKTSMDTRYFVPDKEAYPVPEDGYPLVVWLHGGGEIGTDNRKQIAANDVHAWTETPSQDIFGGAYVLAPQNHAAAGLGAPQATMSVILQFVEEMGDIDMNRIYVGGCSYGGGSTWTMLKTYPNFFAAGFPHCGGTTLTAVDAANLVNTPIYISVSTGDGNQAGANFISLYNQLKAAGSEVVHIGLFEHSEFDGHESMSALMPGLFDHWVWVYFHEDFDGVGDDWDGQNWIANDVDATYQYDGRRVEVKDGVLTAIYNDTDDEGNTVETSVVLEGTTENPVDLGYTSFKAWLADQAKAKEYLTLNHSVASYGETITGITVTLAEPLTELGEVKVEATAMVMDLTTFSNVETSGEIPVKSATLSDDGLTVEIDLGINTMWTLASANAYMDVTVTIGDKVITDVQGKTSDVDVFEALTFTVPEYSWGTTMNARAFTPDKETYPAPENGYPLIVWLHGGGEVGTDNRIQVAANDVPQWTEKETQDLFGGAYVLAPQNHVGGNTGAGAVATMDVILQFIEMKGDIDVTKIYVGGCSYGGMSTWGLIRQYPNFFAAAFPICGVTNFAEGEVEALAASDMPIYMIHSVDDNTVNITGSTNAYTALTEAGKENVYLALFSQIEAEGIPAEAAAFLGHWSWVYVHDDFDASEQYWLETFELTDEEGNVLGTYETSTPAELGATSFKAWLAAQVNTDPSYFKDVTGETENYDAINALFEMGVTNGTGNYEYEPDATLTRAEFMTFLARAVEATVDNTADTGFTDVAVNSWETGSIAWGVTNGLIEGYGDGTFGPEDPVTEEQVNLIIGRLIENVSGVTAADGQTIADATDTPATRGQVAGVIKAVADNYSAPFSWWW